MRVPGLAAVLMALVATTAVAGGEEVEVVRLDGTINLASHNLASHNLASHNLASHNLASHNLASQWYFERGLAEAAASEKLAPAAKILSVDPISVQLRSLQTLTEISTENASTIVFPVPLKMFEKLLGDTGVE